MRRNVAALALAAAPLMSGPDVFAAQDYLIPEILKTSPYGPPGSALLTVPLSKELNRDPYKSVSTNVTLKASLRPLEGPLAAGTIRLPADNVRIVKTGCGNMACSVVFRAEGTLTLTPEAGSWVVAMDLQMTSTFSMGGYKDEHRFPLVESVRTAEGTECQLGPNGGWECA
jgi:hypothetical protein